MRTVIITKLLDKYENSKHLLEPGVSNKRVMLRVGSAKKEFPEYIYQDASIRDAYNNAARELEKEGLVTTEWVKGRPVLSGITLNLERVMECYCSIDREHPRELAMKVAFLLKDRLAAISTDWIIAWKNDISTLALESYRVPSYCKNNPNLLEDLLKALEVYDALHGDTITMRAFSSKCYHDTKYFERKVRELFLRIAQKYNKGLSQICKQDTIGTREQLAYLGIYVRPELYELCGDVVVYTATGLIDFHAAGSYGLAFPSTSVDHITSIDLNRVRRIIFIENKTNYDEYVLSELQQQELVIYHGGFMSPQKKKLFLRINEAIHADCSVFFWADIDLGGFLMYEQLQKVIPAVKPMRMSEQDVVAHHAQGLVRTIDYLADVQNSHFNQEGSPFKRAIEKILEYGITIEQESFLI